MTNKKGMLYGIKGFKSLVMDDYGLSQLPTYHSDVELANAYNKGVEEGIEIGRKEILEKFRKCWAEAANDWIPF